MGFILLVPLARPLVLTALAASHITASQIRRVPTPLQLLVQSLRREARTQTPSITRTSPTPSTNRALSPLQLAQVGVTKVDRVALEGRDGEDGEG
ncbi:hypothetical protein EXIGLDRAFT_724963 [Exidia glandulosa HHB12029]|uniref:Uncharacterized protein n=1 Tax=Exidia glandulosa HHB12029 TaxID=1314781 RepID=A0A165MMH1_EXIGL|nr:hypothetical protein EXIGLDRAFT_724963 [Exidia glandulosa HHB12029]